MFNQIKSYLITVAVSVVATVSIYTYILNNQKNRNEEQITQLKGQIQVLDKLAKDQAEQNKNMQVVVNQLTMAVNEAHVNTTNALAMIDKLKKPVVIDSVDSIEEVKTVIAEHYNDNSVVFDTPAQRFTIIKSTTFALVDDAIEWKVNGPILKDRLFATTNALDLSQKENETKDQLLDKQDNLIKGLYKSIDLCNESKSGQTKIITLLEKDLKIESINGKIKFVIGVGIGAGTYYIIDRLQKR
jgi:regulator of replication initiation timing